MANLDWQITRNDIFERALNRIGALAEGAAINDQQFKKCLQNLNIVTQELARKNIFLWNTYGYTLTTAAGVASYSVTNNDVIGIDSATWTDPNGYRVNLQVRPYDEFLTFTDPNTQGGFDSTTSVHLGYTPTDQKIYFHRIPDAVYTVQFQLVRKLRDWSSASGNDFPNYWAGTLIKMLAAQLAYEFGLPLAERNALNADAQNAVELSRIDVFRNTNFDFHPQDETYERN